MRVAHRYVEFKHTVRGIPCLFLLQTFIENFYWEPCGEPSNQFYTFEKKYVMSGIGMVQPIPSIPAPWKVGEVIDVTNQLFVGRLAMTRLNEFVTNGAFLIPEN